MRCELSSTIGEEGFQWLRQLLLHHKFEDLELLQGFQIFSKENKPSKTWNNHLLIRRSTYFRQGIMCVLGLPSRYVQAQIVRWPSLPVL